MYSSNQCTFISVRMYKIISNLKDLNYFFFFVPNKDLNRFPAAPFTELNIDFPAAFISSLPICGCAIRSLNFTCLYISKEMYFASAGNCLIHSWCVCVCVCVCVGLHEVRTCFTACFTVLFIAFATIFSACLRCSRNLCSASENPGPVCTLWS